MPSTLICVGNWPWIKNVVTLPSLTNADAFLDGSDLRSCTKPAAAVVVEEEVDAVEVEEVVEVPGISKVVMRAWSKISKPTCINAIVSFIWLAELQK
jgi:hypothetical protein